MKFTHEENSFKHPFHIIADFESTLLECDELYDGLTKEESEKMGTKKYQRHLQNSFGVKFCCDEIEHDKPLEIINNIDPEIVSKLFIEKIEEYALDAYKLLQLNKTNIIYTTEQEKEHKINKICFECNKGYTKDNKKVAHHNHITGNFISSLCNECNLKFVYKKFIPVYLHNLKGYDSHLFIKALYKYGQKEQELSCIPNNEEKYISFSKKIKVDEYYCKNDKKIKDVTFEIKFLDTIAFMNSSIEKLVETKSKACKNVEELRIQFPNTSKYFTNDDNERNISI